MIKHTPGQSIKITIVGTVVSHWSKAIYAAEEYFINEAYLIPPPGKKYAMRYMQPQGRDEKGTVKTPHVFLVWHTCNGNIMVEEDLNPC